jgi:ABC-type glycerol-3-phosphate transport system substrate-binding protein
MSNVRRVPWAAAAAVAALLVGACTANPAATDPGTADDPEKAALTYWYWAESDAPGANDWMKARIADYRKLHPGVTINLVPQPTDTLIGAFTTAAQTRTGPDIATQWATMPVLTQVWAGAVAPISDLVPAAETDNWLNTHENRYQGKIWGMPSYLMGIPLAYNKDLFARAGLANPPATWDELLSQCTALRKAGVTPFGMGNKDGFFGAWFFSIVGKQRMDSIDELKQAMIGKANFADPKFSGFYQAMADLKKRNCLNDDIASLTLDQGMQKFGQGQAAMAWGTDGLVAGWAKTLGAAKVGVAMTPKWGTGKLADTHNTTQSSTAFITSWSPHKRAAAQFLAWLHQPANLASWYEATSIFPADKRFDQSAITSELGKQIWAFNTRPGAVWPQNYLPPAVDGDGNGPAGQVVTSGGTPAAAVGIWTKAIEKWRSQHPDDVRKYEEWAVSS